MSEFNWLDAAALVVMKALLVCALMALFVWAADKALRSLFETLGLWADVVTFLVLERPKREKSYAAMKDELAATTRAAAAMDMECVQVLPNGVDDEGQACLCCQRRFDKRAGNPDYFERFGLKMPTTDERIAAEVAKQQKENLRRLEQSDSQAERDLVDPGAPLSHAAALEIAAKLSGLRSEYSRLSTIEEGLDKARVEEREKIRALEFERDVAWHDGPPDEVAALAKEKGELRTRVEQLEELLRDAECVDGFCSWCRADMGSPENTHERDCKAFTFNGRVRGAEGAA